MMNLRPHFPLFLLAVSLLLITSCKDDDDGGGSGGSAVLRPEISTLEATNIDETSALLGGTISDVGSGIVERGVCYGTIANPTVDGSEAIGIQGVSAGEYSEQIGQLTAGTPYHVRAFARQSDGVVTYGQNVSFMTEGGFMFNNVESDVTTTYYVHVSTDFDAGGLYVNELGWVYSTSPNPTTDDAVVQNFGFTDSYENVITGLDPDTDYYIRPFAESNTNTLAYGEEIVVHTAGYTGPGGGVVLYDKGVMTGGWQYLEASLTTGPMLPWGCQGDIVNGTITDIGSGATNTVTITGDCLSTGIAARYCQDLVSGGQSDWFLPSRGGLQELLPSLYFLGTVAMENSYWSSSEVTSSQAYAVNNANGDVEFIVSSKISDRSVLPVRRY